MIYRIEFEEDERIEYCTAKNILHLLQSYASDFNFDLQNIVSIDEITEEKAKEIMIRDAKEIMIRDAEKLLTDLGVQDDLPF
jgi:hypothetical protein